MKLFSNYQYASSLVDGNFATEKDSENFSLDFFLAEGFALSIVCVSTSHCDSLTVLQIVREFRYLVICV